ncbi:MAG: hypothetical protein AAB361_02180 [Patescibacteria group bacterium]
MFKNKINKSSGVAASRTLLIIAIIILVAVAISYAIIRIAENPPKSTRPPDDIVPQPIYEQTIEGIRIIFQEAKDFGSVLKGSQSKNPQWQEDIKTTEKFIKVTVAAQNKEKENTRSGNWDIENIVDSEGRNYVPMNGVDQWLPEKNLCGNLLKPDFAPIPCAKIYEVSRISAGLKIRVTSFGKSALIDLIVTN